MTNPNVDRACPAEEEGREEEEGHEEVVSRASGKRVYNCIESHDQHQDWSLQKAKGSGLSRQEAEDPGGEGSSQALVERRQPGGHRFLRRLGARRFGIALPLRQIGKAPRRHEHISVRYIWMAAKEMDHKCAYPTTFLDDAGTSAKSALRVVRKIGALKTSALPFEGRAGQVEGSALPEGRRTLEGDGLLQSVPHAVRQAGSIQGMARVSRADPDPPESGPELEQHPAGWPAPDIRQEKSQRRPRRRDRRLHAQRISSFATAGAPAGATRDSPTRATSTRWTPFTRRTESSTLKMSL